MSVPNVLESTVNEILVVITPLRDDWVLRTHIIQQLQSVVDSVESLRGATVEAFGSFVSNLFSRWSDLDISIELPNGSFISSAGRKHKQSILRDVQKAMRRAGGWGKLQFLSSARVPILKFETVQNISCDVSICNLIGQGKSRVLFWISGIDNRFRDMVLLTCVPAILPPLKEIYPGNIVDDLTGIRETAQARIAETCAANIKRFKEDKSRRVNRSKLSELFISFLAKFADIGVMASNQGISVYTGQWEDIETNTRWLPKTYALFVEDPFEQPENPARTVSNRSLERISQVFKESHRQLISAPNNRYAIIATLASPQISNFLASPEPPIFPRNSGPHYQQTYRGVRPQQQFFRAPQPQTQFQQRYPYHPTPRYSPRTQFRHPNPTPDGHRSATQSPHQRPQSSQNRVQQSPRPRP